MNSACSLRRHRGELVSWLLGDCSPGRPHRLGRSSHHPPHPSRRAHVRPCIGRLASVLERARIPMTRPALGGSGGDARLLCSQVPHMMPSLRLVCAPAQRAQREHRQLGPAQGSQLCGCGLWQPEVHSIEHGLMQLASGKLAVRLLVILQAPLGHRAIVVIVVAMLGVLIGGRMLKACAR